MMVGPSKQMTRPEADEGTWATKRWSNVRPGSQAATALDMDVSHARALVSRTASDAFLSLRCFLWTTTASYLAFPAILDFPTLLCTMH